MGRKVKKSSKLLHDLLAVFVAACLCISMVPVLATADPTKEPSTPVSAEESGEELADEPSAISVLDDEIAVPDDNGDGSDNDEGEEAPEPEPTPAETPETPEVVEPAETVDGANAATVEPSAEEAANSINVAAVIDEAVAASEEAPQQPTSESTIAMIGSVEYATLQEAIDAAKDNDRIVLHKDSRQNITIANKTITIDLNGFDIVKTDNHTNSGAKSVVTISDGSNVTFAGKGYIAAGGATTHFAASTVINDKYRAITATGSNLTIDGPTVSGALTTFQYASYETVDKTYGGAIYVGDGDFELKTGKITGGVSKSTSTGAVKYGGCVAVKNGSFKMSGGTIETPGIKASSGSGGAVYVVGKADNSSVVNILGGTIKSTRTFTNVSSGGNVYISKCATTISGDAEITNGRASTAGGNIYVVNGSLNVTGGKITDGLVTGTAAWGTDGGGGILAYNSPVSISGGEISNNTTDSANGGGISVYGMFSMFEMTGGAIADNTGGAKGAKGNAGGVYLNPTVDNAQITIGGTIKGNTATPVESIGGGVYVDTTKSNTAIDIKDAVVTENEAGYGAGVAFKSGNNMPATVSINGSTKVYNNHATNETNAIPGTSKNKTDEFLFNYASKVAFCLNGEKVADYADVSFNLGASDFKLKMAENSEIAGSFTHSSAVSYYGDEVVNITREDCIDGIVLDPKGVATDHYAWDEETDSPYLLTSGNGLYSSLTEAITAAKEKNLPVYVCSETLVSNQNIDGQGIELKRCSRHHSGTMLRLSKNVSLSNITIDGCNYETDSAMIFAESGSRVAINNGTVIKNAVRSGSKTPVNVNGYTGGGALEMNGYWGKTTLDINGGTFESNEAKGSLAGGAIWCFACNVNIASGSFCNNKANGSGGALFAFYDSKVNISGGDFVGNTTKGEGGAVCFESYPLNTGNHGVMSSISGGTFTGNKSYRSLIGNYYGGGAVYNGIYCSLAVYNAVITGNTQLGEGSLCHGGAIGNCKMGTVETYQIEGVLVYDNKKGSFTDNYADIAFCTEGCPDHHAANAGYASVSDYALGGGFVDWKKLDKSDAERSYYQDTQKAFTIVADLGDAKADIVKEAELAANVWFTDNHAYGSGSAIMNNGRLTFGGDKKNLRVVKTWSEIDENGDEVALNEHPDSVTVQLAYKEGNKVIPVDPDFRGKDGDSDVIQVLSEDNGWKGYWADLGTQREWTVVELSNFGYEPRLSSEETEMDGIPVTQLTLNNIWKNPRINISAEKWWDDQRNLYGARPESIFLGLQSAVDTNKNGVIDDNEAYEAVLDNEGNPLKLELKAVNVVNDDGSFEYEEDENGNYILDKNGNRIVKQRWYGEFRDLAKYTKLGQEIKYLINEDEVIGYVSKIEPVITGQKPILDENGEQVKDEDGNLLFENEYIWSIMPIAVGDEEFEDATPEEWMSYNITNTLEFADIEFTKSYEGQVYQDAAGNGNSTAVFRITGEFNGVPFYDNVVSANFTGEGSQKIEVKGLLVGAEYTIEELTFDGSGYTASGEAQTFTLTKDGVTAADGIEFVNTSDETETPNQGVINRYSFVAGNAVLEQFGLKLDQVA